MARKVKLAFIMNNARRKATYKKRKEVLLNKVSELSTLCGIHACAIVYSPYDYEPEVWPSTLGVQHVISQFKRMQDMEKTKRILDQETYLRERIAKVRERLKKQWIGNREKEITELMFQCLMSGQKELVNLTLLDLDDLQCKIEQNLKKINRKMEAMRNMTAVEQVAPPPPHKHLVREGGTNHQTLDQ